MKKENITSFRLNPKKPPKTDWRALDTMSEAKRRRAALSDPNCRPASKAQLAGTRRVPTVAALRTKLKLTQEEFAVRFRLPLGTVRDWEQGAHRRDKAAQVLLTVIAKDPDAVMRALDEPMVLDLTVNRRKTPLGGLLLVVDGDGILRAADFADCEDRLRRLLDQRLRPAGYRLASGRVPVTISRAVDAYFDGELSAVQNIPISLDGTAFQEEVWGALRKIELGRTVTYAGLARKIGRPQAARALGHANAANPLCIVVPCHRLIGTNGDLTGYSGGVERKRWLLDHEAEQPSRLKGSSAEFESKNWIAASEL